jgi:hypothetical protein
MNPILIIPIVALALTGSLQRPVHLHRTQEQSYQYTPNYYPPVRNDRNAPRYYPDTTVQVWRGGRAVSGQYYPHTFDHR